MTIKTLQVGPIMTNCYLLFDEDAKVCALIDPGDDAARVEQLVRQSGCALKYIPVSYTHLDVYKRQVFRLKMQQPASAGSLPLGT